MTATPKDTLTLAPTFLSLNLKTEVQKAIDDLGYISPSPIQVQTIPALLERKTDLLGLAATGTGKTAAFGIPLISKIDLSVMRTQALILCPTRELAIQVTSELKKLSKYMNISMATLYGGVGYADQIKDLKRGAQIVVGTPGRISDHLRKELLNLKQVETIVLDEADEMLSMGFQESIEDILSRAPQGDYKTWLFSATMSPGVRKISSNYLKNPVQVQINSKEVVPSKIEQLFVHLGEMEKKEAIVKILEANENFYGLIFCQTKVMVSEVTQYLNEKGHKADCMHGDMDQKARERTLAAFKRKAIKALVCTDVASRGIDVPDITHVVNHSLPRELDSYIHRIGRTARSGKTGVAISLVTKATFYLVSRLERMMNVRIKETKLPTRKEIAKKRLAAVLEKGLNFSKDPAISARAKELLDVTQMESISEMDPITVATGFLSMILELDKPEVKEKPQREERSSRSERSFSDRDDRRSYDRDDRRPSSDRGERNYERRERSPERRARSFSDRDSKTSRAPRSTEERPRSQFRQGSGSSSKGGGRVGARFGDGKPRAEQREWVEL